MRRVSAQKVKELNKDLNKKINISIKKGNEVAVKLLKNDDLTQDNFHELLKFISVEQNQNIKNFVFCKYTDLSRELDKQNSDISENPIFIFCQDVGNKIVFCIVKQLSKTFCLCVNFSSLEIQKDILEQYFGKNIEYKILTEVDKPDFLKHKDIVLLGIINDMISNLNSDKKEDFINGFDNSRHSLFHSLKTETLSLRNKLFSYVKDSFYKNLNNNVNVLSEDEDFKKAIKEFIKQFDSLNLNLFTEYHSLLKEFVEREEKETLDKWVEELKKARKKAFDSTTGFQKPVENHKIDIENKFPKQMKTFTEIFEPLRNSILDDELVNKLREICSKLGLEYTIVKKFFETQKKENSKKEETIFGNKPNKEPSKPHKSKSLVEDTNCKSLEKLLSDVRLYNLKVDTNSLKNHYVTVKEYYDDKEKMSEDQIKGWARSKKGLLDLSETFEALAILDRANELVTGGHKLRDTQLLAVLTFLLQKDKGQLIQIETGEGKTTIVSMLAAIKALQGETVDVVTGNPVLASDAIKDKLPFYNLLGLTAAENNLDENYKSGQRECYKADIVYGNISNFQFDFLKDSFLGLKTRGCRPFGYIILDEVDSMIIDNANHISKLSEPLPGMESLKYVYINIWLELVKAEKEKIEELEKEFTQKAQELKNDEDYLNYIKELPNKIIEEIKLSIKESSPTNIDIIPSHIKKYAVNSLDRWIISAIEAKYNYHEDVQYIIRDKNGEKVIQPVDYANTGITLKNTVWQYGLHQFLQLKHNLRITLESLTSCYISNLGYIKKYGNKIFGLTGTLGSEVEQKLLSSIYNVGYAKIPTFKEKKFSEIEGEVMDDEDFSKKVADDVICELCKGRAALVICETIKDGKNIQNVLESEKDITIKTFFDEETANITEEEIGSREVVIATNIAGRGTNFITSSEVEKNNGLFVCVAFLPCNKRVEDQAFGRTARQGNNGTAKLIIKRSEIEKLGIDRNELKKIKEIRDQKEKDRIEQLKNSKIPELKFQDKLFKHFSRLYKDLKIKNQNKEEYKYVLEDLKASWSFWLDKKHFNYNDGTEKEFKDFESEAKEIIEGKIEVNSYYSIQQAEYFILSDKLHEAEIALKDAINKDPDILYSAYIKLFEIEIEKGRVFIDKCQEAVADILKLSKIAPDKDYKKNAVKYLNKAKEAFNKELSYIDNLKKDEKLCEIVNCSSNELVHSIPNEPQKVENLFLNHLVSKHQALMLNVNHVDTLIQKITDSDGVYIGSRVSNYFSDLKPQNDNEEKIKKTIKNPELNELATVGLNTTYVLEEMQNICKEIIDGARLQILGGISIISSGFFFPPAIPVTSVIGGTMVGEGLSDIAIELINKNSKDTFNKEVYIKNKVISYGICIFTMGINAIMECPKILNLAKNACRRVSETLRKCPHFKIVCENLAKVFDKLGNWFEKVEILARFKKMSKSEQLNFINSVKSNDSNIFQFLNDTEAYHALCKELQATVNLTELTCFEKCVSGVQDGIINTFCVKSGVAGSHIINKAIASTISKSAYRELMPKIKNIIKETVMKLIGKEKFKSWNNETIENTLKIIENEAFKYCEETISKYWNILMKDTNRDQFVCSEEVINCVKDLYKEVSNLLSSNSNCVNQKTEAFLNSLIQLTSEKIYHQIMSMILKIIKKISSF